MGGVGGGDGAPRIDRPESPGARPRRPAAGQPKEPVVSSSRLEIDLRAVDHNIRTIRGVVSPSSASTAASASRSHAVAICAVLKQDAYGLGAVRLAKRVTAGQGPGGGVELLAVFAPDEARELAEANVTAPVLVLSPVREIDEMPTEPDEALGTLGTATA